MSQRGGKKFTREERAKVVAVIRKLKNEGLTCAEVTKRLNEGGWKTANGKDFYSGITGFYYHNIKRSPASRKSSLKHELDSSEKEAAAQLILGSASFSIEQKREILNKILA